MKYAIAMTVVAVGAFGVNAGPLKRIQERREARHSQAEVVVNKDGTQKVVVRGNREAVITKDKVEIRQAPAPKKN